MLTKQKTSINDLMLDRLAHAKRAVAQLKRDGFTVIGMDMSAAMPTLQIQSCGECRRLVDEGKAIYYRMQTTHNVRERFAQFTVEGCRVIWVERGN